MSEKKVTKKPKSTKTTAKNTEKKKKATKSAAPRNEKGQFIKGQSGNPGGRPKISDDFRKYAEKSPAELWAIVQDEETGKSLKASILMWFSEMYWGKASQQVDVNAEQKVSGVTEIRFEGEIDEWAT